MTTEKKPTATTPDVGTPAPKPGETLRAYRRRLEAHNRKGTK